MYLFYRSSTVEHQIKLRRSNQCSNVNSPLHNQFALYSIGSEYLTKNAAGCRTAEVNGIPKVVTTCTIQLHDKFNLLR